MQLYFDTWQELQNGATAFINHLLKWGLKAYFTSNERKEQIQGYAMKRENASKYDMMD